MPQPSQEFIRATVHLAGAVELETGHSAHYSAAHVQARIGSALLYLLDYAAAADLARAAAAAADKAAGLFPPAAAAILPPDATHSGQESSLIVRMRGRQTIERPRAVTGQASRHGRPYLTCQVGGLVVVCHDAEALARLVQVADTAHRVAAVLWPAAVQLVHDEGPDGGRDRHAEQWEQAHHRS